MFHKILSLILNATLISGVLLSCDENDTRPIFPRSKPVSKQVDTLNFDSLPSKGHRLAAVSLQGLVNRDTPVIFLLSRLTVWQLDDLRERGYVEEVAPYGSDLLKLIEKHQGVISGAVVYDPDKLFTVNTATNIAGTQGRIIISPDMVAGIQALGIDDIFDIRDMDFGSLSEAYAWELEHCLPLQSEDVLSISYYSGQTDYGRDYLIANAVHTFWVPGEKDPEYDSGIRGMVEDMLSKRKHNIPCLGFWYSVSDEGVERGIGEYYGVEMGGFYGKYTVVSDWSGNYSFNSGVPVNETKYKQRKKAFREYDPEAKYVALIMIESGDSPGYMQHALIHKQWNDPLRGKVPVSIGVTPTLRYLAPIVLEMMYDTMTENEYFFTSISGIGYCYPLRGYGKSGASDADEERINSEYFAWTARQMKDLDMTMMGLYSHTWSPWNHQNDDAILNRYVVVQPQIKTIIADMGRNDGPTVTDSSRFLENDVTIHHTMTRWSTTENFGDPQRTPHLDQAAADDLAAQIREYGQNRQFTQAMFYSWHYGPTRLAMVQDQLAAEGYTFVTLDEFDDLFRRSSKTDIVSDQSEPRTK